MAQSSKKAESKKRESEKLAVISTGGKQYLVKEGDELTVEKLPSGNLQWKDLLAGRRVEAEVTGQRKGEKVKIVKFRAKTRYLRRRGHRQTFAEITIKRIV